MATAREYRTVLVLTGLQALYQITGVVIITAGGLAGYMLAPDKSLATLPISAWMIGTMVTTIPASLFMGRFGRRPGFALGTLFGVLSGTLAVVSLINGWFWLFCFAHVFNGAYQGFAQFYRFAAADAASPAFRSRAISYVLLGPAIAAVIGPHLVAYTKDFAASGAFVASYATLVVLSLAATLLVAFVDVPKPLEQKGDLPARPLSVVVLQSKFLLAVVTAAVGYGVMNLAMTATPLAMQAHHHGIGETAFVIQWHVLGMFLPSFFTGNLIARFGAPRIMLAGVALLLAHVTIALSGVEFIHFASALTLLGIGWNFTFLGGTNLITETYRPSEKAWAQGLNDFSIFTTVVITSFASGALLHLFGWVGVNLLALPLLLLVGVALIVYQLLNRAAPAAAAG
ncbi:MAG TPA: MFS transporter [Xanthobacteraceae bacterium]|jgi:MFS family permease